MKLSTAIFLSILLLPSKLFALTPIRILTWWGYLDPKDEHLKKISTACHADLHVDEYYSNREFERRFSASPSLYDILIYQETNRGIVGPAVESNQHAIKVDEPYSPVVQKQFLLRHYLKNTKLFQISLTGLFWIDNQAIKISKNTPLSDIFRQFHGQVIAILDDYAEAAHFFKNLSNAKNLVATQNVGFPDKATIKKVFSDNDVIFASDIDRLVTNPKFGIALTWSGTAAAIYANDPAKAYRFLIHPELSYASSDLISLLNEKAAAKCVANALASRAFIDSLSEKSKYFSPYGTIATDKKLPTDVSFSEMQRELFDTKKPVAWLEDLSAKNHEALQASWLDLKSYLSVNVK